MSSLSGVTETRGERAARLGNRPGSLYDKYRGDNSNDEVTGSRVIYEPHPTQPGATIATKRITTYKSGTVVYTDLTSQERATYSSPEPVKPQQVSIPDKNVKSYSEQTQPTRTRRDDINEMNIRRRGNVFQGSLGQYLALAGSSYQPKGKTSGEVLTGYRELTKDLQDDQTLRVRSQPQPPKKDYIFIEARRPIPEGVTSKPPEFGYTPYQEQLVYQQVKRWEKEPTQFQKTVAKVKASDTYQFYKGISNYLWNRADVPLKSFAQKVIPEKVPKYLLYKADSIRQKEFTGIGVPGEYSVTSKPRTKGLKGFFETFEKQEVRTGYKTAPLEYTAGVLTEAREKPTQTIVKTAAWTLLPGALKYGGKLVAPVAAKFPGTSSLLSKTVSYGLLIVYGTSVYLRSKKDSRPFYKFGRISAGEIAPMAIGSSVGAVMWSEAEALKTISRYDSKFRSVNKLVRKDVITGTENFPTAPSRYQYNMFVNQRKYKLPIEQPKAKAFYHATPDKFPGVSVISSGSSEVPGLYGSTEASIYFLKVGRGSSSLYGGSIFQPFGYPRVIRQNVAGFGKVPKGFKPSLSKTEITNLATTVGFSKVKYPKQTEFLLTKAKPGYAYVAPTGKTEIEAVIPPGASSVFLDAPYYTKIPSTSKAKKYEFFERKGTTEAVKRVKSFDIRKPSTYFDKLYSQGILGKKPGQFKSFNINSGRTVVLEQRGLELPAANVNIPLSKRNPVSSSYSYSGRSYLTPGSFLPSLILSSSKPSSYQNIISMPSKLQNSSSFSSKALDYYSSRYGASSSLSLVSSKLSVPSRSISLSSTVSPSKSSASSLSSSSSSVSSSVSSSLSSLSSITSSKLSSRISKVSSKTSASRSSISRTPRSYYPSYKSPPSKPPIPSYKRSKGEFGSKGFNVLLKRFGKFEPIGYNLPKGKALRLGVSQTKATLGATFKIEESGKATSSEDIMFIPGNEFRSYRISKGKKVPLFNEFIQKRSYRLGTRGEKSEIKRARRKRK